MAYRQKFGIQKKSKNFFKTFQCSSVQNLAAGVSFAPIGLIDMFNAGGAISALEYETQQENMEAAFSEDPKTLGMAIMATENGGHLPAATIKMAVRGCGWFGAYSSMKPRKCLVETSPTDFSYDSASGLLKLILQKPDEGQLWNVTIEV